MAKYQRITVDGPFEPTDRDARRVRATVETATETRQITLTITGQRRPRQGSTPDLVWQAAMGFLTLLELEKWNLNDLPTDPSVEFPIDLLVGVNPREVDGVGAEAYVQQRLWEYALSSTATRWQAKALPERDPIREIVRTSPNPVPVFIVRCHKCPRAIYVLHDASRWTQAFPYEAFIITCPACGHRSRYSRQEVVSSDPAGPLPP